MSHQIITVSGSLRMGSSNSILLQALQGMAPQNLSLFPYQGLGDLPHFNPDRDTDPLPAPVQALRSLVETSQGLIISSPEYVHGVPGSLKNALDWLVSTTLFEGKPLVLLNVSASAGAFAHAQLEEILRTMGARLVQSEALTGAQVRRGIAATGQATDPALIKLFADTFAALAAAIG